jgi:hypothetical protein
LRFDKLTLAEAGSSDYSNPASQHLGITAEKVIGSTFAGRASKYAAVRSHNNLIDTRIAELLL